MSSSKAESGQGKSQPGQDLKHARERSGVSIQYVSEQTKITLARLESLEQEDYAQLGGTAYVTGYTRAYCKVLDVDPQPFVDAFERHIEATQSASGGSMDIPIESTRKMAPSQTMLIAVLLGFVLLIGVLWFVFSDRSADTSPPSESPDYDESQIESSPEPSISEPTISATETAIDQVPVAVEAMDEADVSDEFESNMTSSEDAISEREAVSWSESEAVEQAVQTEEASPSLVQSSADGSGSAASAESAAQGSDVLTLAFEEECWLEIREASGKRIAARLALPGDQLRYVGQAPFSVKLGNARAATVFFNGDPVDFQVKPGARTLKLAVGP